MKTMKRLFAGLACALMIGGLFMPVHAAGYEPLDWDTLMADPNNFLVVNDWWLLSDSHVAGYYRRCSATEYSIIGGDVTDADKTFTLELSDGHGLQYAQQTVTVDIPLPESYLDLMERTPQYFMDFNRDDRDGYFGLNEYSDDYNCEGFYHNFERNPFTDYRFTVSFGFSIKLHPDGHANSFGNPCISFEDAVNGVREYHQVTTESEINGRTVFTIEDEGRVDDHAIYRNYDYIIYYSLPEVPGFYLNVNIHYDMRGPEDYQGYGGNDGTAELNQIISAHKDIRETIETEIIPDLINLPVNATWGQGWTAEDGAIIVQTENNDANIDPGEDEGTTIRNEIVETPQPTPDGNDGSKSDGDPGTATKIAVSVGGAVVAGAVALGGRSGKKNGAEEDEKKRKTYKMKVFKNFGDGLRRGAKPVPVWARIVEVVDGHERNRPDLSERITASGEGMTVSLAGIQNTYQTAMVSVPMDSAAAKAALVFTFAGDGGVFRNRISFRVLGEPRIVFPRLTEDGTGWVMNADLDTVRMVAGMGGTARLRFVIADADEEPVDITFGKADGFSVKRVKDTELAFTYWAEITNRTLPMEKENGVFAEPENRDITIRAEFADGSAAENAFRVELWPDGISVPAKDARDGALEVDTRPDERAGEGFAERKPAGFEVYVCYTDTDGAAVILENPTLRFGRLDDGGKYGLTFQENFEYDLSRTGSAGFLLFPKVTLPMLAEPYEAVLPISCEGVDAEPADLPLRLMGEMPEADPGKAERALELKRLRKDIAFFGLDSDLELLGMVRAANRGDCSAEDIRNIRYRLLEAATFFYERERDAQLRMADLFSQYIVVAGALQTAGDYALKYVMNYYWPGYGGITIKFINPFKNILLTYVGEQVNIVSAITSEYSDGIAPAKQVDFVEVALKSAEDAMAEAIGFLIAPDDVTDAVRLARQAKATEEIQNAIGYVVATYLLVCYVEHYYGYNGKGQKGEKGDVFRSVLAACADLGYESLKAWVLGFIQKKCRKLFEEIGKGCGELFKKVFKNQINAAAFKAGQKAFGENIKGKFQDFSNKELGVNYSELSQKAFDAAKTAKEAAKDGVYAKVDSTLEAFAKWLGEEADGNQKSVLLGLTLNYFLGGVGEDGTQSVGGDAKEVLYEAVTRWLGVKVGAVYEIGGVLNPYDVTYRVEDGKIKLGIFGCIAEISILENIIALSEWLFESLFEWLGTLWEVGKTLPDSESIPDPRVRVMKSTVDIANQLEKQKLRDGRLEWQWQFAEYKKKTESGWETII